MRRAAILAAVLALTSAAPALAQTADPRTETMHVVKPGETLGGIANRAEVPRVLIIEANGLKAPYALRAGQKLVIPRRRSHTVKDGETGFGIAMDYGVPWVAIAQANGLDPKDPVKPAQVLVIPTVSRSAAVAAPAASPSPAASASTAAETPAPRWAWPAPGKVRRKFNGSTGDDKHDGIDILAPRGTAARAAAAGKVIFAGQGPDEYGLTVIVFHGGLWTTTYSFLDKITVKDGDDVGAGERVGLIGDTGLATEPQLHFEIRRNKVPLDPVRYLPKR
jgi:murein DD-endopeptidase MepM/ murein hydrolase activator NlpD